MPRQASTSTEETAGRPGGAPPAAPHEYDLIAPLKVPEEPDGPGTKWKRLFNAVVARQNKSQDGKALVRLVMEVMAAAGR